MALDNSCQNFRGRNFKDRQDLAGANFSYADIRGANFTNANLTGANFSYAKAGLQRRWAIFLVLVSWLLSGFSGFYLAVKGYLVSLIFDTSNSSNQIGGWTALIILIAFFLITIRQGLTAGLGAVAGAFAVVVAFAVAFALAGAGAGAGAFAGAFAVGVVGAFAVAVAGAIAG
ncbi:pentapeptide repeat-containing protein, partial [Nostoc sp. CALU 546]|uniref:pentapeptide repeat-containing protein n=1 Tax=Nostoc sp. CALU 546 TaxID=1867241 RepID=UPI003B680D2F